jgi:tRNA(Ile)-lysidine synthase
MLIAQATKTIQKYGMLKSGDRVIVGVSGGPDSMAVLYLLHHLGKRYDLVLQVAHLNHGFREREAQRDAHFVEHAARELGLPCVIETFDVPAYKKSRSLSSQEAARIIRYRFLEEVRKKTNASKIALGHNADDQAETLMMWLLRGTGLKGLGGMPPVRDGIIIRPLIETTRKEIETFLSKKDIPFVVDSSNQTTDYVRNRLRQELFPLLTKNYNPQIVKKLVNTASIISLENEYLENISKVMLDEIIVSENRTSVVIGSKELLALPLAMQLRCLRTVLEKVKGSLKKISSIHLYDMLGIVVSGEPHKVLKLPDGIRVEKSYFRLKVTSNQVVQLPFYYHYSSIPDRVILKEIDRELSFKLINGRRGVSTNKDPCVAYLDAEKVSMPLIIRNARPGDRFQPFGMKGEKKIKNYFIDEKVPQGERKRIPLVFAGDMLGWVGGMRINHCLRVTSGTRRVLKIAME